MDSPLKSDNLDVCLDSHELILGDCLEILPKLPDHIADLVITDPPFYLLNKKNLNFNHRSNIIQNTHFDHFDSYEDFMEFTRKWSQVVAKKMKNDSSIYIFFGAQYISDLMRIYLDLGFKYKGVIVWHKTNPAPKIRKTGYLSSTELILFMTKGNPVFNFLGQNQMHNFIETPICMRPERLVDKNPDMNNVNKSRKFPSLHPAQKPMKVIEKLIKVSSDSKNLILDPFMGTGTTNAVSKKLNRFSIGIESNYKYFKAAEDRIKEISM